MQFAVMLHIVCAVLQGRTDYDIVLIVYGKHSSVKTPVMVLAQCNAVAWMVVMKL